MKKISRWAKFHPAPARIIIVAAHSLLIAIAFKLSAELANQNIKFSQVWIYIFIVGFFIAAMYYPGDRVHHKSKWHYATRKTFDFVIGLFGFCIFLLLATELNHPVYQPWSATAVTIKKPLYKNQEAEKLLTAFKAGQKHTFTKKEKKTIRQEFNYQLKEYAKAKITGDKAKGNETIPIILCCIAAVGLLFLVASLSCTLGCEGSGTGAVLVAVVGTAAIIWLLIIAIKAIKRKSNKNLNALETFPNSEDRQLAFRSGSR